jgi:hypothetical protein
MGDYQPYRPSNGTEGDCFTAAWCSRCERDVGYKSATCEEGCGILVRTYAYAIDDPEYPTEWRMASDGAPYCTAFVPIGNEIPDPLDPAAVIAPLL